jgi:hypothetical protein
MKRIQWAYVTLLEQTSQRDVWYGAARQRSGQM